MKLNKVMEKMKLMTPEQRKEILEILEIREEIVKYRKLEMFKPLPFQKEFFKASKKFNQRFLMAANRVGKSYSESMELAMHLTGQYPDWYEGRRFDHPIKAWAIGISIDSTRKVLQQEMFGTITSKDTDALGTGSIPRECINFDTLEQERNLIKVAQIKHRDEYGNVDGYSTLEFRSSAQGEHALMGAAVDYIWMDEEDPYNSMDLYMQCLTRTMTLNGMVTLTATPENGRTELIDKFHKTPKTMYIQNATWWDACSEVGGHLTEKKIQEMLESYPVWMRDMRSKGIPVLGNGMVYEVQAEQISCEPFEIPTTWKQIAAVDIGFDHPTAVVWTAYDAQRDTIYVTDVYKKAGGVPFEHAHAINCKGKWIPVVLPHDSQNTEKGSGVSVAERYKEAGINALPEAFYNPIDFTGSRNYFVMPGVMNIHQRMKDGRFKVFSHCKDLFEELAKYHFKDGKIAKVDDDIMDAMRYSAMSVTHRGKTYASHSAHNSVSHDNWDGWNNPY